MASLQNAGLAGTSAAPSARAGFYGQYMQSINNLLASQAQQTASLGTTYQGLGMQQQGLAQGAESLGLQQQSMNNQNAQNQAYLQLAQQSAGQQQAYQQQAQQGSGFDQSLAGAYGAFQSQFPTFG